MAGRPARNLSVRCAVSRSGRAICERSRRGSPTVMINATPNIARAPCWLSNIMREHHEQSQHIRGQSDRPRPLRTLGHRYRTVENRVRNLTAGGWNEKTSSGAGFDFGGGVECVERAGGIDNGRAGIDGDRNTQHFGYLFPSRTPFPGLRGMYRDAAVAAQGDGDRKRDEFAGLFIEVTGLLAGPTEGGIALDDIGVELAEAADPGEKLLPIGIPIQHVHDALLFDAM